MKLSVSVSVIVIAKDEEKMIGDCLASVKWADEIILVDSGSADKTIEIAKKCGAKIVNFPFKKLEFAKWRNAGLKAAKGDWILYLDADERVTPELKEEILQAIVATPRRSAFAHHPRSRFTAYEIPRKNFYLGKEVHYGGAWPDYVKRLFLKEKLKYWKKELHEDPIFEGKMGRLKSPFIHLTHRDLSSMVEKTKEWSKIEAKLLDEAGHPPVTWWRILRVMLTEFWCRGIKLQGLRDGVVGWIEVIFQMFSRFVTYARLWEMQHQPKAGRPLDEKDEK